MLLACSYVKFNEKKFSNKQNDNQNCVLIKSCLSKKELELKGCRIILGKPDFPTTNF